MELRAGSFMQAGAGEAVGWLCSNRKEHGIIIFDIRVRFSQGEFLLFITAGAAMHVHLRLSSGCY